MERSFPIAQNDQCDVVVAGGGMAGAFAALASATAGADTVLIEEQAFVGGQATAGGVHTFCGETRLVNDLWRDMLVRLEALGGLAEYRPNTDGRAFDSEVLKFVLQEMLGKAGVRLLLHTRFVDVDRTGSQIEAVYLHNKSGFTRLSCKQVVDATGDADVIARSGSPYLRGGPALAPGDHPALDKDSPPRQLPMSLYFTMIEAGANERVAPVLPPGCPTFKDDEDVPMITVIPHGRTVTVKMKVIGFDVTNGVSLSEAEQEARRQMMGVVYHLQTIGFRGATYPSHKLAWAFPHIGIREGRRVVAQHILTADEVLAGCHQPDAVAVGSYHIDYHWPNVLQRAGTGVTTQCPPYHIPFRALRPKDLANVLVPGRCLSGEQMAMSSFRVMGICAQTGFAAGIAAAFAVRQNTRLDEIDQTVLREELRREGVRLDLAPYNNYLRRRRGVREIVTGLGGGQAGCLGVAQLPDGSVIAAWTSGSGDNWRMMVSRRYEERWLEPVEIGESPPLFEINTDSMGRLSFDLADAVENNSPGEVRIITDRQAYSSEDGGISWVTDVNGEKVLSAGHDSETVHLIGCPNDPQLSVKFGDGKLHISDDRGETWSRSMDIKRLESGTLPAYAATTDGLIALFVSESGSLDFSRIPFDTVHGLDGTFEDWHHNDAGWVALLSGFELEAEKDPRGT
jgi:hypothetical protein